MNGTALDPDFMRELGAKDALGIQPPPIGLIPRFLLLLKSSLSEVVNRPNNQPDPARSALNPDLAGVGSCSLFYRPQRHVGRGRVAPGSTDVLCEGDLSGGNCVSERHTCPHSARAAPYYPSPILHITTCLRTFNLALTGCQTHRVRRYCGVSKYALRLPVRRSSGFAHCERLQPIANRQRYHEEDYSLPRKK